MQLAADGGLMAARVQMGFTLGFHIVLASLWVGLPVLCLLAEWRFLKTGDPLWRLLARRWSKAFALLFAVGAVSGTVLSFELGLLWPEFMARWGAVFGVAFTLEGFAFFIEAIFVGIYLYGWDRLSPRAHWWSGVPVALSGAASAAFVMTVNAWMNAPRGFDLRDGVVVDVRPLEALWNPASGAMIAHMLVAAYMVTGLGVAAVYAFYLLRGGGGEREATYRRRAMLLGLALGLPLAPLQGAVGHWAGQVVAETQPVKLAAMEAQFETVRGAPARIGGIPDEEARETRYALEIPGLFSLLAYGDFDAEVRGLNAFPREDHPPVAPVHFGFQAMVGIGTALIGLALWTGVVLARRRRLPAGRFYLRCVVASGPLTVVALLAGWVTTEVGRQPWVVQGYMRTAEAVTDAPGLVWTLLGAVAIYGVLGAGALSVLRLLAKVPLAGEAADAA